MITIGDVAEVKGGKRLPKGKLVQDTPTAHRYIRVTDFTSSGVDEKRVKYIDSETQSKISRYTISTDDVYISIAGTIGLVGQVPESLNGANLTENAAKICEIKDTYSPKYISYFLKSDVGKYEIKSRIVGTSQPKLALFRIKDIPLPEIDVHDQQIIAGILEAYDNLIENNSQRIEILEQMAENLYKMLEPENHNKTVKLEDVISLNYGKALKAGDRKDGAVPVYGSSGVVGSHDTSIEDGPGIILGRKGNVGSVFWSDEPFYPIDTVYSIKSKLPLEYVYFLLKHLRFINNDTAVPGLSRKQAYMIDLALPSSKEISQFAERAGRIIKQISTLKKVSLKLNQTRDLLLPHLISGEIEV